VTVTTAGAGGVSPAEVGPAVTDGEAVGVPVTAALVGPDESESELTPCVMADPNASAASAIATV
jgi:hypothetical protein